MFGREEELLPRGEGSHFLEGVCAYSGAAMLLLVELLSTRSEY